MLCDMSAIFVCGWPLSLTRNLAKRDSELGEQDRIKKIDDSVIERGEQWAKEPSGRGCECATRGKLWITKPLLYQLSYVGKCRANIASWQGSGNSATGLPPFLALARRHDRDFSILRRVPAITAARKSRRSHAARCALVDRAGPPGTVRSVPAMTRN